MLHYRRRRSREFCSSLARFRSRCGISRIALESQLGNRTSPRFCWPGCTKLYSILRYAQVVCLFTLEDRQRLVGPPAMIWWFVLFYGFLVASSCNTSHSKPCRFMKRCRLVHPWNALSLLGPSHLVHPNDIFPLHLHVAKNVESSVGKPVSATVSSDASKWWRWPGERYTYIITYIHTYIQLFVCLSVIDSSFKLFTSFVYVSCLQTQQTLITKNIIYTENQPIHCFGNR